MAVVMARMWRGDESAAHDEVASPSAASAVGRLDPREIAEAFSRHRFDEAFPFLAEDVRWTLRGRAPVEGRAAVIAACRQTESFLRDVTTAFPRFVVVAEGSTAAVDVIARYEGADGSATVVSSCDVYEFRDGLVAAITSYTVELDAPSHQG